MLATVVNQTVKIRGRISCVESAKRLVKIDVQTEEPK
jgi:hypothetical protein